MLARHRAPVRPARPTRADRDRLTERRFRAVLGRQRTRREALMCFARTVSEVARSIHDAFAGFGVDVSALEEAVMSLHREEDAS